MKRPGREIELTFRHEIWERTEYERDADETSSVHLEGQSRLSDWHQLIPGAWPGPRLPGLIASCPIARQNGSSS